MAIRPRRLAHGFRRIVARARPPGSGAAPSGEQLAFPAEIRERAARAPGEAGEEEAPRPVEGDRDAKFCQAFRTILQEADAKPVRLPAWSPNLNAHLERFLRSLKGECLNRMILFGEPSLRRAVSQFLEHFHRKRNHQGLDNCLIDAGEEIGRTIGEVKIRERLGGLLKYYYREAA